MQDVTLIFLLLLFCLRLFNSKIDNSYIKCVPNMCGVINIYQGTTIFVILRICMCVCCREREEKHLSFSPLILLPS